MDELREIWNGLNWSVLTDMLFSVIPALMCIMIHEISHGLVAYWMGDETAKRQGRLSLNPLRHIDPMGLVMLVVFRFGWAKSVNIDMSRFRNPKRGMALTALAGPVSNFLLAAILMAIYGFFFTPLYWAGKTGTTIIDLLSRTIILSIGLGVFNMFPIPPLDGSKVLFSFLPDEIYYKLMQYERYGMIIMVALLATGILSTPLGKLTGQVATAMSTYIAAPLAELGANIF